MNLISLVYLQCAKSIDLCKTYGTGNIMGCTVAPALCVNGTWESEKVWAPIETTALDQSPKNCHRWLQQGPQMPYQIWCTGGFWQISKLQVRELDQFWWGMATIMQTHAKVCLVGVSFFSHKTKGVKSPKNPNFGSANRQFQAKHTKYFHIIVITTLIPTKFCTTIKTINFSLVWSQGQNFSLVESQPFWPQSTPKPECRECYEANANILVSTSAKQNSFSIHWVGK